MVYMNRGWEELVFVCMLQILIFHVLWQRLQQVVFSGKALHPIPGKCGDLTWDASQIKEIFSLCGASPCIAASVSPPCGARKIDLVIDQITTVFTQLCGSIQVCDNKLSY